MELWASIKEIFTKKNREIKKLREEIQSKEDALQDYYQIIETFDKEREIDSKLYTDKREKLYQDQQSKYEIELLAKDEQIEILESKIKYHENMNEPQHQNKESFSTQSIPRKTESQTTINKLHQDLKKYREKVTKTQTHIMESDLLPELEKKQEKLSYPINSRLKQQHIILDTNILLRPTDLNQDEVTRNPTNLLKLLNQINNNSFTPIIYFALNTEYKKFFKQLLTEIKNGKTNWLEDYPVIPLVFYLQKSREAPQDDDNYNNNFRINQKKFRNALTPEEGKELAESGRGNKQYDIIHAVTAITTDAILVTEDHGLLRLKNNPEINLKAYPLTSQEVSNNFNVPILNYLDSLITSNNP